MTDINIVLVGKTGHGKSSTGSTILQRNSFEVAASGTEGTEMLELKTAQIEQSSQKIRVYDTPGILTLLRAEKEQKNSIREEMKRLMDLAKTIHVFIFVFNYICRFTQEEKETVKDLKEMFGENFLKDHGMVVVTHGDNCEREALESGVSCKNMFDNWCTHAGIDFKSLKSEVGENILLVNNKGDFIASSHRMKSSHDLRSMIRKFENKPSFTKQEFDKLNRPCKIL